MRVRIIQLLCPARHCIVAVAYVSPGGDADTIVAEGLRATFDKSVTAGHFNPWCELCRSREFHIEDAATPFATMAEALPALKEEERKQAETRKNWRASKG